MPEHLNNLSLLIENLSGKKDIGYTFRTKIERELFLLIKDFCKNKLSYDLQGMESKHKKEFDKFCEEKKIQNQIIKIVHKAFNICYLLWGLASSNPYVEWGTVVELGKDKAIKISKKRKT
ncbi:hypothetical protein DRN69_03400 [Candidatus Pacearchaeota archaeon]|nr:MAG: hypothetical protein DRN69_03400 [Candidatus Pacearchaeota archaeon]